MTGAPGSIDGMAVPLAVHVPLRSTWRTRHRRLTGACSPFGTKTTFSENPPGPMCTVGSPPVFVPAAPTSGLAAAMSAVRIRPITIPMSPDKGGLQPRGS